jgi:hypothetical protein
MQGKKQLFKVSLLGSLLMLHLSNLIPVDVSDSLAWFSHGFLKDDAGSKGWHFVKLDSVGPVSGII